jgi:hypothetical protein
MEFVITVILCNDLMLGISVLKNVQGQEAELNHLKQPSSSTFLMTAPDCDNRCYPCDFGTFLQFSAISRLEKRTSVMFCSGEKSAARGEAATPYKDIRTYANKREGATKRQVLR